MGTTELIIIVVILTVVAYYLFGKKKPSISKTNKKLEDLITSDRFEISEFGPHKDRFTVEVTNKNKHVENGEELFWYEFEGLTNRNEDFWLQLESIDPYELNGGTTKINVYELGTSIEDLMSVTDENLAFRYKGQDFYFDTEGSATRYLNGASSGQNYSYREFTNENEDMFVTIEAVQNEEPKAYLSFDIDPNQIQILS